MIAESKKRIIVTLDKSSVDLIEYIAKETNKTKSQVLQTILDNGVVNSDGLDGLVELCRS